jgi:hypothetical protein
MVTDCGTGIAGIDTRLELLVGHNFLCSFHKKVITLIKIRTHAPCDAGKPFLLFPSVDKVGLCFIRINRRILPGHPVPPEIISFHLLLSVVLGFLRR